MKNYLRYKKKFQFFKDDFKSYGFYRGLKIVSGLGKTCGCLKSKDTTSFVYCNTFIRPYTYTMEKCFGTTKLIRKLICFLTYYTQTKMVTPLHCKFCKWSEAQEIFFSLFFSLSKIRRTAQ